MERQGETRALEFSVYRIGLRANQVEVSVQQSGFARKLFIEERFECLLLSRRMLHAGFHRFMNFRFELIFVMVIFS